MKKFIGRTDEMRLLEKSYSGNSNLILLTGRRRIGKTRLIKEFLKGKDAIYFLATNVNESAMLDEFGKCIQNALGTVFGSPRDWSEAFSAVVKDAERRVLVLDEFSYMIRMSDGFLVRFQGLYDEILKDSGVLTILCGSHRTIMERLSDDYNSPLYGRFDRRITLKPLDFYQIPSTGDICTDIERYSVHGGIPRYMEVLGDGDLPQAVREDVMDPSSMMFEDPLIILESDAGLSNMYLSIIKAIGRGNHRLSEIASALEVGAGNLPPYLVILTESGFIRKEIPITENNPENSKKGKYVLNDHFAEFWFRFVYPFRPQLAFGDTTYAMSVFEKDFVQKHVGFVFEDICGSFIRKHPERLGFLPEKIGKYWDRNTEVDIVVLNTSEKRAFVGECKYKRNNAVDRHVLNELRAKVSRIKELEDYDVTFGLFSVSGFDDGLDGDDVLLFGPEDLISKARIVQE